MYKKLLYFDIETVGNYKSLNEFIKNDKRGSDLFYKKCEKTSYFKDADNEDDAYKKYSGLFSPYGKIVCISIGYFKTSGDYTISSFKNDDEKLLLTDFANLLVKVKKKNFILSGYGIFNFDIPWVVRKMIKYGIKVPSIIDFNFKKPWEMSIYDILEAIKLKSTYYLNLDEVCYELGIESPKDKIDGSMVHETYWNGDLESIVHYCEKDIKSTMLIAKKIFEYYE